MSVACLLLIHHALTQSPKLHGAAGEAEQPGYDVGSHADLGTAKPGWRGPRGSSIEHAVTVLTERDATVGECLGGIEWLIGASKNNNVCSKSSAAATSLYFVLPWARPGPQTGYDDPHIWPPV